MPLQEDRQNQIVELKKLGKTLTEIARVFNIHHTTVIYYLKKAGFYFPKIKKPRPPIQRYSGPIYSLKDDTYKQIIKKQSSVKCVRDSHGKVIEVIHTEECVIPKFTTDPFVFRAKKNLDIIDYDSIEDLENEVDLDLVKREFGVGSDDFTDSE